MGVLYRDREDGHTFCPEGPGKQDEPSCFYCGVSITGKGVYWHGWASDYEGLIQTAQGIDFAPEHVDTNGFPLHSTNVTSSAIHMHYTCARLFLVRLARDIWAVEGKPQPTIDG